MMCNSKLGTPGTLRFSLPTTSLISQLSPLGPTPPTQANMQVSQIDPDLSLSAASALRHSHTTIAIVSENCCNHKRALAPRQARSLPAAGRSGTPMGVSSWISISAFMHQSRRFTCTETEDAQLTGRETDFTQHTLQTSCGSGSKPLRSCPTKWLADRVPLLTHCV